VRSGPEITERELRYGQGENNGFEAHKWPFVRELYRRTEEEAGRYGEKRDKTKL
jgi:hypothetical protein